MRITYAAVAIILLSTNQAKPQASGAGAINAKGYPVAPDGYPIVPQSELASMAQKQVQRSTWADALRWIAPGYSVVPGSKNAEEIAKTIAEAALTEKIASAYQSIASGGNADDITKIAKGYEIAVKAAGLTQEDLYPSEPIETRLKSANEGGSVNCWAGLIQCKIKSNVAENICDVSYVDNRAPAGRYPIGTFAVRCDANGNLISATRQDRIGFFGGTPSKSLCRICKPDEVYVTDCSTYWMNPFCQRR